jgi:hypothetical protein
MVVVAVFRKSSRRAQDIVVPAWHFRFAAHAVMKARNGKEAEVRNRAR